MKPLIQILEYPESSSFVAKTVDNSWLETGWHQHPEYELILFTKGFGETFIGKQMRKPHLPVGRFEPGNIFLLGSNLPHSFQWGRNQLISAVVIQFKENCFGNHFMHLPECKSVKQFLEIAGHGLKFNDCNQQELQQLIESLVSSHNIDRIILLLKCIKLMMTKEFIKISTDNSFNIFNNAGDFIEKIFTFTYDNFQDNISLQQVASATCMSIPSFCHYFKEYTNQTYIDYLNQVRVEYACQQLLKTNKSVSHICFESGYNTIAHFHRQFFKLKRITPLQYRKTMTVIGQTTPYKITTQAI